MAYTLKFEADAWGEWQELDKSVREPLKKKLTKRLDSPRVPNDKLVGNLKDCYKIKNNKTGHRLIYQVIDHEVVVLVLSVDKRERLEAHKKAAERIAKRR